MRTHVSRSRGHSANARADATVEFTLQLRASEIISCGRGGGRQGGAQCVTHPAQLHSHGCAAARAKGSARSSGLLADLSDAPLQEPALVLGVRERERSLVLRARLDGSPESAEKVCPGRVKVLVTIKV